MPKLPLICDPAGLLQESLGPFGPEVSLECPRECPRKRGVSEGVSDGVFPGLLQSVQKVPRECPRSGRDTFLTLRDTLGTLFGHSRSPGARNTPSDTPSDTPRFRGHSRGHSGETSGPKGPRDSCSRPTGIATFNCNSSPTALIVWAHVGLLEMVKT